MDKSLPKLLMTRERQMGLTTSLGRISHTVIYSWHRRASPVTGRGAEVTLTNQTRPPLSGTHTRAPPHGAPQAGRLVAIQGQRL